MKQTWHPEYPTEDLEPHPDNPRRGDVNKIAESIDVNGFFGAILMQSSRKRIIAGEHRWRAARKTSAATVPVLELDVTDEEAMRIMLADNRTSDTAGYDTDVLLSALRSFVDGDVAHLEGTGYTDAELARLVGDNDPTTFAPVDEEPPRLDQRAPLQCPHCEGWFTVDRNGKPQPVEL